MLLLAIDTSGKNGSITLARVEAESADIGSVEAGSARIGSTEVRSSMVESIESVPIAGGTFSAQLIPQISALLTKNRASKSDLAGFVVISGPGSFTGLRVGLAAIKGLAEVLQKPIAAVSLLEVIASSAIDGRVLAALDAGRNEVYVGEYEIKDGQARTTHVQSERMVSREELVREAEGRTVVTPDAVLAEFLQTAGVRCERIPYPSGAVIAEIGWRRIQRGEVVRPEELDANYIRRSDAEIFSQPSKR